VSFFVRIFELSETLPETGAETHCCLNHKPTPLPSFWFFFDVRTIARLAF